MVKTKTKSRKKNPNKIVAGVVFRHLVGRSINDMPKLGHNNCNLHFFSNSRHDYDPNEILKQILNKGLKSKIDGMKTFCFGVIEMKNHTENYFLCEVDTLYITAELTHIHTVEKTNYRKKA